MSDMINKIGRSISKFLNFSPDILANELNVTVYGGHQAVIDGYNKILDCDLDWSKDWSIEADYKQSNYRIGFIICDESMTSSYDNERYALLLNMPSNPKAQVEYKNSSETLVYSAAGSTTLNYNTYYPIKFVKEGTTISVYFNNVLLDSRTNVDQINTANIGVYSWDSKNGYLKNLKIKPL